MVAGNRETLSASLCMRPFYDVHARAIVLEEIEVDGREVREWIAEIANNAHRFEKHFRQNHSGPYI